MENNSIVILSERLCRKKHHVSYDTILGAENAFKVEGAHIKCFSPLVSLLNKVFKKLKLRIHTFDFTITATVWGGGRNVLFMAMSIEDILNHKKELRTISLNNSLGIYIFDAWESRYSELEELLNFIKPSLMFFPYIEAKKYFDKKYNSCFIPQSMDEKYFYPRKVEKHRMFMQMGRRNEKIHNMIMNYLENRNLSMDDSTYIYEKKKGKILFDDTNDLATEIAATKYFVAAPQSLENKALTGKVSDVTARFYEAMACKTLIIGYKPATFDLLFPEDSMLEVGDDDKSFASVIDFFEKNPKEYWRIVNRNYEYLMHNHTWRTRYKEISSSYDMLT